MWESIIPNRTVTVPQMTKQSWSNLPVGTTLTNMNILKYTDFQWTVHSPDGDASGDSLYPSVDHTLGKKSGNYLVFKAQSPQNPLDRAVLVSDHYDIDSSRSFCLKFYYYAKTSFSKVNSKIEVYQGENNNKYKKIAQVVAYKSTNTWQEIRVSAKAMSTASKNIWFYLV